MRKTTQVIFYYTIFLFSIVACILLVSDNSIFKTLNRKFNAVQKRPLTLNKALLASRYPDLKEFEKVVKITYLKEDEKPAVRLTYQTAVDTINSYLRSGVTQGDFEHIKDSNYFYQSSKVIEAPHVIRSRKNLKAIYLLARRRVDDFGHDDVAFYDLAFESYKRISIDNQAFKYRRDSSEKGYINTFNHITAQTLITILFDEETADLIADLHELHHMPELVTGKFSPQQLADTLNYPVDNYVDMINNELGQELGKYLKTKYEISSDTKWTNEIFKQVLNEILIYYEWSFDISIKPFSSDDFLIRKFTSKINALL